MEKEIWSPINGYEGLYEVSNLGNVRSLGKGKSNASKKRNLKNSKVYGGYLIVRLCKNGKMKNYKIHRLVAEAFIPNWFDEPQVNHIDENKLNNNVDNLEWCDAKYNSNHGTRNERIFRKTTNGKLSKPVLQFTKTGEFVREWPSANEAGRNGYNQGKVTSCCRGEQKKHKGYIWKYKEV